MQARRTYWFAAVVMFACVVASVVLVLPADSARHVLAGMSALASAVMILALVFAMIFSALEGRQHRSAERRAALSRRTSIAGNGFLAAFVAMLGSIGPMLFLDGRWGFGLLLLGSFAAAILVVLFGNRQDI